MNATSESFVYPKQSCKTEGKRSSILLNPSLEAMTTLQPGMASKMRFEPTTKFPTLLSEPTLSYLFWFPENGKLYNDNNYYYGTYSSGSLAHQHSHVHLDGAHVCGYRLNNYLKNLSILLALYTQDEI